MARHGDAEALRGETRSFTYAALGRHADALAAALRAAGVAPDEPVPVRVSNQPEDLAALLAVWRVGAVAVPVHRASVAAAVDALLEATAARLVVDALDANPVRELGRPAPPRRPLLEGAALVIFTSGSTGTPKGVVLDHARFAAKLEAIDSQLRFAAGERSLLVLNITFVFGLWFALLTLLAGGTVVVRSRFDAAAFLETLAAERIDRVAVVPTMMRALFTLAGADAAPPSVAPRQMVIGGEPLGVSLAERIRAALPATRLVDIYGLTETSSCDFYLMPEDHPRFSGCIGRPGPGESYRIVDAAGTPVASGEVGELEIETPYLMRGYLDAPALTAAALRDGRLRTGDLARERAPGVVELAGRAKELISRGGNKVAPLAIDHALSQHPDVTAALAVGVPDPLLGERIHVLLVPRPGARLDAREMLAFAATRLERWHLPDAFHVAAELPQGRTGKADRAGLRAMIESGMLEPLA
jgi:acyl-CoA synthetase (AMP-forming)/AMP-acid ligase II